jgi:hypothetical protein
MVMLILSRLGSLLLIQSIHGAGRKTPAVSRLTIADRLDWDFAAIALFSLLLDIEAE